MNLIQKVAAGDMSEAIDTLSVPASAVAEEAPAIDPSAAIPQDENMDLLPLSNSPDLVGEPATADIDPIEDLRTKLEAAIGKTTQDLDLESETDNFIQE